MMLLGPADYRRSRQKLRREGGAGWGGGQGPGMGRPGSGMGSQAMGAGPQAGGPRTGPPAGPRADARPDAAGPHEAAALVGAANVVRRPRQVLLEEGEGLLLSWPPWW